MQKNPILFAKIFLSKTKLEHGITLKLICSILVFNIVFIKFKLTFSSTSFVLSILVLLSISICNKLESHIQLAIIKV